MPVRPPGNWWGQRHGGGILVDCRGPKPEKDRAGFGDPWLPFAAYTVLLKRAKYDLDRLPRLVVPLTGAVIAALPFFIYKLILGEHANLAMKGYLALACAAIPGGALMYLLYNWSVDILGASRAGGLLYTQIVFTAVLAWLILGQPIETNHLAGAALIVVGVVLVTFPKPAAPTPSR